MKAMKHNFRRAALCCLAAMMSAVLMCGCTAKVKLENGKFPVDTKSLVVELMPYDVPKLAEFTALESADFSGSECYAEIAAWAEGHPAVSVRYSVPLPDGSLAYSDDAQLDLSRLSDEDFEAALPLMKYLPAVETVTVGESVSAGWIERLAEACPEANFEGGFTLAGRSHKLSDTELDISGLTAAEADSARAFISGMKQLKRVELGTEPESNALSWDAISAMVEAAPEGTEFNYDFTFFGKACNLQDSLLDLNHIKMDDEGALVKQVAHCMPNLQKLDMDFCGVSDEAMADIRDSLPNVDVVWRIWFGTGYTVRTDVERILASNPGRGGELTGENAASLKYCTKVKYLDLGHNSYLDDLSFVSYMPDLEVLIVAMANWSDLSPVANCPKLEYAEIQNSALNDLSPLAELKNLRHLNIGYCFALHDLSPLYGLTELERLWIGKFTPIPMEQIEHMRECAPNCEVNIETTLDPNGSTWRYLGKNEFGITELAPRYELLRQQMHYDEAPFSYAYIANDPLYYAH